MSNIDKSVLDQYEIGGNFFELIEFSLDRELPSGERIRGIYGINVAKVREVVHMPRINALASSVNGLAGIFELRGVPIPAVNLSRVLGDRHAPIHKNQQIIVTEFSQKRAGFIVSTTHRIRRVAWDKVMPPSSDANSCMTGMILMEDNDFLFILDLERILNNLELEAQPKQLMGCMQNFQPQPNQTGRSSSSKVRHRAREGVVFVVDDSRMILNNLDRALGDEGFEVLTAPDGLEALSRIHDIVAGRHQDATHIAAIITDIEMPRLDGISLVRELRKIRDLQNTPILLHSSLDGDASKESAANAGADGYIVKNDLINVVESLKHHIEKQKDRAAG